MRRSYGCPSSSCSYSSRFHASPLNVRSHGHVCMARDAGERELIFSVSKHIGINRSVKALAHMIAYFSHAIVPLALSILAVGKTREKRPEPSALQRVPCAWNILLQQSIRETRVWQWLREGFPAPAGGPHHPGSVV